MGTLIFLAALCLTAVSQASMPPNMTVDGVPIHTIGHGIYIEDFTGEVVAIEVNPFADDSKKVAGENNFYRIFRTEKAIKHHPQADDKRIDKPWDYEGERKKLGNAPSLQHPGVGLLRSQVVAKPGEKQEPVYIHEAGLPKLQPNEGGFGSDVQRWLGAKYPHIFIGNIKLDWHADDQQYWYAKPGNDPRQKHRAAVYPSSGKFVVMTPIYYDRGVQWVRGANGVWTRTAGFFTQESTRQPMSGESYTSPRDDVAVHAPVYFESGAGRRGGLFRRK